MRFHVENNTLGSIVTQGNVSRIRRAFVDEVSFFNRNNGYILISYAVPQQNGVTTAEQLRLNVNNSTTILNEFGLPIGLRDIRRGTWVDATFSSRMTRSIPPQANALVIITRPSARPPFRPPSGPETMTTTERVLWVDCNNNILMGGMPNNMRSMTRYVIADSAVILNRNGLPISLCNLRPGQLVQITRANFQTASIPPQTTAFRIQVV